MPACASLDLTAFNGAATGPTAAQWFNLPVGRQRFWVQIGKLLRERSWLIVTTEEWKMRQTTGTRKNPGEKTVKDIKRATRRHYSSEGKVRIVLDGLRFADGQVGTPRHDCRPG
jgi:hypothetical protein